MEFVEEFIVPLESVLELGYVPIAWRVNAYSPYVGSAMIQWQDRAGGPVHTTCDELLVIGNDARYLLFDVHDATAFTEYQHVSNEQRTVRSYWFLRICSLMKEPPVLDDILKATE